jgi:hypothetical protein
MASSAGESEKLNRLCIAGYTSAPQKVAEQNTSVKHAAAARSSGPDMT